MGTSERYNMVPVKDNHVLFLFTPYFQARAIRWCRLNFSPANPLLLWQRILGQN